MVQPLSGDFTDVQREKKHQLSQNPGLTLS